MGNSFFNEYPYTDFHELNLSWVIKELRTFATTLEQFVSINALKYADPIQWNITKQYEKNTIVIDPQTGTAYISVAPVPAGVALTNEDYWTIVFDLGAFVVRASKNFASVYEAETTTSASVNISKDTWLVWGDTLYKANVNITAGDTYVPGGNITHFTIEDVIGHLNDLTTSDKTNLVNAINELVNSVGDLDDLTTTDKSSLVNAINEIASQVLGKIGDLDNLTTTDKSSLVNAINEVNTTGGGALALIGDLDDLTTTDKSDLVNAINEVDDRTYNKYTVANIYLDGTNGSDDNDGLTIANPMQTLEGAYSKYSMHTYVNIIIISDGTYEIGNNLDTNLRFYSGGHGTVITAQPGVNATISGYFYWFGGHVELWNITITARIDLRNSSIVLGKDSYTPIIDSIDIAYFNNCNLNLVRATINSPINTAHCNISIASDVVFNETSTDRVKIIAVATKIVFNGGSINTTVASMAQAFIRAYGNTEVSIITMPSFTGKYGNVIWANGAKVTLANQTMNSVLDSNSEVRGINAFNNTIIINSNYVTGAPVYVIGAVNLNTYNTAGKWYVNSTSASNRPVAETGMLEVIPITATYIIQYFYPDTNTDENIYIRKYDGNNWSSWKAITPVTY